MTDTQETENAESFAFALVNGSLGVFELRGRRVRDFRYSEVLVFSKVIVYDLCWSLELP